MTLFARAWLIVALGLACAAAPAVAESNGDHRDWLTSTKLKSLTDIQTKIKDVRVNGTTAAPDKADALEKIGQRLHDLDPARYDADLKKAKDDVWWNLMSQSSPLQQDLTLFTGETGGEIGAFQKYMDTDHDSPPVLGGLMGWGYGGGKDYGQAYEPGRFQDFLNHHRELIWYR